MEYIMHDALKRHKALEYARFIHLLFIYVIALLLFLISNLPHSWWILSMTLSISSSIEPGLMLTGSMKRAKGTIVCLFLLVPLIYTLQLNYRFVPIVFIAALAGFNIVSVNFRRYDLTVFFNTLAILFILAQTTDTLTLEGPIETVINRGVSTGIAIMIVIFGDHFLFNTYQYSQKLYLFHQKLIYDLLSSMVKDIQETASQGGNTYLLLNKLRTKTNEAYKLIANSAENLQSDLKVSDSIKQQVALFQTLIWDMRQVTFALCFSKLMLKSDLMSKKHLLRYNRLLKEIRKHFIVIE